MANLLSASRIGDTQSAIPAHFRTPFETDIDRIVFSDAFRRLQDKTQVHGPSGNDYVRSRLTHSIEVSRVGRQIGAMMGLAVARSDPGLAEGFGPADFGAAAEAACLMHDIGNPPFGHTGESAVSEFFKMTETGRLMVEGLDGSPLAVEAAKFEGNAQGFRTVAKLQGWRPGMGLQLTSAVLAASCKYPFQASSPRSSLKKGKYGFFASETAVFAQAAQATGMTPDGEGGWKRHPLAYAVEAADDICYRIVDIVDGYAMGCIGYQQAAELLSPLADGTPDPAIKTDIRRLERLASMAISRLVKNAGSAIEANARSLIAGDHPGDIIFDAAVPADDIAALRAIEKTSRAEIYAGRRRQDTDLLAHRTISSLLEGYLTAFLERELGKPSSWARAVLRSFPHSAEIGHGKEDYVRAVLDHVAGMTDAYAIAQSSPFAQPRRLS